MWRGHMEGVRPRDSTEREKPDYLSMPTEPSLQTLWTLRIYTNIWAL